MSPWDNSRSINAFKNPIIAEEVGMVFMGTQTKIFLYIQQICSTKYTVFFSFLLMEWGLLNSLELAAVLSIKLISWSRYSR